jgi:hypothetical protein
MQGKVKEQWVQLCEQAAVEQDSTKLMALVREIARMLYEKEQRLKNKGSDANEQIQCGQH